MKKNHRTALHLGMLVLAMFCLVYAAFPLYSLFCKVTGYGGAPQVAETDSILLGKKIFTVRFNADVNTHLPWFFLPEEKSVQVRTGKTRLIFYQAKNLSEQPLTGVATYNVTPDKAGLYFNKIACFCFENQRLEPGEVVDMPVSFFIDPAIENDPDLKHIDTITLSYSFFPAKE